MSSKIYEEYMNSHPDGDMNIASVGFVLCETDRAMDTHNHDGENSPLVYQASYTGTDGDHIKIDVDDYKIRATLKDHSHDISDVTYLESFINGLNALYAYNGLHIDGYEVYSYSKNEIDVLMGDHATKSPIDHPDGSVTTAKIADLTVTVEKLENVLDLQPKSVYVKTPARTNNQSEFPETGGELSNTYTRSVIDSKLATKSDTGHTHIKSQITDFPTSMKNPQPLIINGQEYDGSSSLTFEMATEDVIVPLFQSLNSRMDNDLMTKANINHIHEKSEITDFPDVYTKNETDDLLSNKSDNGHIHEKSEIIDFPDVYTKTEADALLSGKSNNNHNHAKANITDFSHTHDKSEIIGLGGSNINFNFQTTPNPSNVNQNFGTALSLSGILLQAEDNPNKHYRLHCHVGQLALDNPIEDWATSPPHHVWQVSLSN